MKNRIKELRQKNNLTLKELGQKVGMANNTLSQYETGKREPKLETLKKLADYFDVPVPYLQGYTVYTCDSCGRYFMPEPNARRKDIACCPYCFSLHFDEDNLQK
ncbi:helix-turn-helix transcriptional regulator [Lactobacillus helveticus]|uniref:Putative transcriptional regulator n=1 Tax=Lactobacillus helveticus CIRM-BIA 951 TaxID=1226334 RepID=U6F3Q8_LACHE|nr:helix-turn-helix transcriptional regulator [Lactobacillus helveticus]MDY0990918.1 helix-turn-helix transcriptional regulator [Lactobacillus helveticus]MDY1001583.1 helix-turn-helix transcriptional regulator [Lactobacillus helveticus]MEB2873439.1 helix-turn-helix transcriptional regulator [Lactobacillus helveticus]CDI58581.1 Putative transcriptional regulator [Lactobacillus helveticus CIRM-BIA 951]